LENAGNAVISKWESHGNILIDSRMMHCIIELVVVYVDIINAIDKSEIIQLDITPNIRRYNNFVSKFK